MTDRSATLAGGEYLQVDDYLRSANGGYMALMQGDGNFVVYRGARDYGGAVLWASQTVRGPGAYFATLQADGNFVLYAGTPQQPGPAYWASQTAQGAGTYFLILQGDGNLVLYHGRPLWATNTSRAW